MLQKVIAFGALTMVASAVQAEGHSMAAKVGVLGLGVEYAYQLNDRVSLRGGLNGSQYGFDGEESGIFYDFDLVWDSLTFAVDFHPRRSALRLTGGVLGNDNGMRALSRPVDDIMVGGTTYTPAEVGTLRAELTFDSTAPFVGIGWDWSRNERVFGVSFDMGVLSQGTPSLTLAADGSLLGDPMFEADIAAEQAQLQADFDKLDLLPYMTLGFVFRF